MNWQWMPSVIFVSYLLYGLARPWVSRKWRREIEIEPELPDTENIDENTALSGSEDEMDAARLIDAERRGA
jgi:CDP-diacylglycerol--serine O-phosphatidyltransferase